MPTKQNVFTKVSFFEDGKYKHKWYRVGCLKTSNGGKTYLNLFHLPDVIFYVMEEKKPEEVNVEDLPVIE